jgi:tagatose 1,6-diphosphate aldolase
MQPGKLRGLRRLADDHGRFKMLAVDQRPPVYDLIARQRNLDSPPLDDVIALKRVLIEALAPLASAVLVDPRTAFPSSDCIDPRQGMLLTLEDHRFDDSPGGRSSHCIDAWSVDQIKRVGADGVKLLLWYRPDASRAVRHHQLAIAERTGTLCRQHDIAFVLELLTYHLNGHGPDRGPIRGAERLDHVLTGVEAFAPDRYGVDMFKVESPVLPADLAPHDAPNAADVEAFSDLSVAVARPWVLLSGGSDRPAFLEALQYACAAGASGFLAGRSIWWDAVQSFPDLDAVRATLRTDAAAFMQIINELTDRHAVPWFDTLSEQATSLLGGSTEPFPAGYGPMHDAEDRP